MKKTILLATVFLSALYISCSKDDDGGNADPVVGKWQQTEISGSGTSEITTCQKKETIEFRNDGRLILTVYEASETNIENCENVITTEYKWLQEATNTYDIIENSGATNEKTFRVSIFVIKGVLTLRSNDIFIEEGANIDQISKKYKQI
ncbi:hypothetical protein [Aquimarina macrocephali]|uniref:hypothetical protein n=1 Tax=Aquimarina macrocephali TaxID=666563 RepID=UPI0004633492|nr:hypothetical protein [Aquimarina macrocephali]